MDDRVKLSISHFMVKNLVFVAPENTISETIKKLYENHVADIMNRKIYDDYLLMMREK